MEEVKFNGLSKREQILFNMTSTIEDKIKYLENQDKKVTSLLFETNKICKETKKQAEEFKKIIDDNISKENAKIENENARESRIDKSKSNLSRSKSNLHSKDTSQIINKNKTPSKKNDLNPKNTNTDDKSRNDKHLKNTDKSLGKSTTSINTVKTAEKPKTKIDEKKTTATKPEKNGTITNLKNNLVNATRDKSKGLKNNASTIIQVESTKNMQKSSTTTQLVPQTKVPKKIEPIKEIKTIQTPTNNKIQKVIKGSDNKIKEQLKKQTEDKDHNSDIKKIDTSEKEEKTSENASRNLKKTFLNDKNEHQSNENQKKTLDLEGTIHHNTDVNDGFDAKASTSYTNTLQLTETKKDKELNVSNILGSIDNSCIDNDLLNKEEFLLNTSTFNKIDDMNNSMLKQFDRELSNTTKKVYKNIIESKYSVFENIVSFLKPHEIENLVATNRLKKNCLIFLSTTYENEKFNLRKKLDEIKVVNF